MIGTNIRVYYRQQSCIKDIIGLQHYSTGTVFPSRALPWWLRQRTFNKISNILSPMLRQISASYRTIQIYFCNPVFCSSSSAFISGTSFCGAFFPPGSGSASRRSLLVRIWIRNTAFCLLFCLFFIYHLNSLIFRNSFNL